MSFQRERRIIAHFGSKAASSEMLLFVLKCCDVMLCVKELSQSGIEALSAEYTSLCVNKNN